MRLRILGVRGRVDQKIALPLTLRLHPTLYLLNPIFGQVARNVAEHYSWANLGQNYLDLFEELASHEHQSSKLAQESLVLNS